MKQRTRELLVTTKAAQQWQEEFERRVDELMLLVESIDNMDNVQKASEMLDVYHSIPKPAKAGKKGKVTNRDKPFEFLVFRN